MGCRLVTIWNESGRFASSTWRRGDVVSVFPDSEIFSDEMLSNDRFLIIDSDMEVDEAQSKFIQPYETYDRNMDHARRKSWIDVDSLPNVASRQRAAINNRRPIVEPKGDLRARTVTHAI